MNKVVNVFVHSGVLIRYVDSEVLADVVIKERVKPRSFIFEDNIIKELKSLMFQEDIAKKLRTYEIPDTTGSINYLACAISIAIETTIKKGKFCLKNDIYPQIASKFGKTEKSIEKLIYNALKRSSYSNISVKEFIVLCIERLS